MFYSIVILAFRVDFVLLHCVFHSIRFKVNKVGIQRYPFFYSFKQKRPTLNNIYSEKDGRCAQYLPSFLLAYKSFHTCIFPAIKVTATF